MVDLRMVDEEMKFIIMYARAIGCIQLLVKPSVKTLKRIPGMPLRASIHANRVAPVVQTSSMSSTCLPSTILPSRNLRNHWQMSNITDATRQLFTLIVAALTESFA